MNDMVAIVLAAGEGTRMKSKTPKVLHKVCGKPMLYYILDAIRDAGIKKIIVVTGYKANMVKGSLDNGVQTIKQEKPIGTADAVNCTKEYFRNLDCNVLILYGDNPIISSETICRLIDKHKKSDATCTLLTATLKDPTGYGRIIRNEDGKIARIVEEEDASIYEKVIEEINVGVYCFRSRPLFEALSQIKPNNRKNEFYLTDTLAILSENNEKIESVITDDRSEISGGISSRNDLIKAHSIIRKRALDRFISGGVTIIDPETTYIDSSAKIGEDTIVHPFSIIEAEAQIGKGCKIGPFCRIRTGTRVEKGIEIGNFVVTKEKDLIKKNTQRKKTW